MFIVISSCAFPKTPEEKKQISWCEIVVDVFNKRDVVYSNNPKKPKEKTKTDDKINMAYSEDYRKKVLEYKAAGHTFKDLKEVFGVDNKTHDRWKKQLETGKNLTPNYPKTRKGKIEKSEIERILSENPTIFQKDIAALLGCSQQAVCAALKRLKITRKKGRFST